MENSETNLVTNANEVCGMKPEHSRQTYRNPLRISNVLLNFYCLRISLIYRWISYISHFPVGTILNKFWLLKYIGRREWLSFYQQISWYIPITSTIVSVLYLNVVWSMPKLCVSDNLLPQKSKYLVCCVLIVLHVACREYTKFWVF
jgi:hypothetical protein